jgi:hypothetical protein
MLMINRKESSDVIQGSYCDAQQQAKQRSMAGDYVTIWHANEHGDPVRVVAGFDNIWHSGKPWPEAEETDGQS